MIYALAKDTKRFISESLLICRIEIMLYLVGIGIKQHILKSRVVVLQHPGIDLPGRVNHLTLR